MHTIHDIFYGNLMPPDTLNVNNILLSIAMSLKKCYNEEGDSMPKKREIKIELNAKEEAKVHYEMEWGKNGSIKRQAAILYHANQGAQTMTEFCQKTGFDPKTVSRMLNLYETMGIEAIYKPEYPFDSAVSN